MAVTTARAACHAEVPVKADTTGTRNILGLSVNPLEAPGTVKLYISHAELFAKGGSCFSGAFPYSGQVSALTSPNFDVLEPIAVNLPVSNHDHSINGSQFNDNGDLFVLSGGNTNAGIPHCNLGGTDESPFTTALLRLRLSQPDFNGNVDICRDDQSCSMRAALLDAQRSGHSA